MADMGMMRGVESKALVFFQVWSVLWLAPCRPVDLEKLLLCLNL